MIATCKNTKQIRTNSIDLWQDIFDYTTNLNGNWFISKDIYRNILIPTIENNPVLFAKWLNQGVQKNNIKIKQKSKFLKTLKSLKKYKLMNKTSSSKKTSMILLDLLNSGLAERSVCETAINQIIS